MRCWTSELPSQIALEIKCSWRKNQARHKAFRAHSVWNRTRRWPAKIAVVILEHTDLLLAEITASNYSQWNAKSVVCRGGTNVRNDCHCSFSQTSKIAIEFWPGFGAKQYRSCRIPHCGWNTTGHSRRDLPIAVHAKDNGRRGIRLCLDARVEGMGDGSDKLVTVDVRKGSPTFGKVINASSVGGRGEAHHGGFTDDRRQFWLPDSTTARSIFLT